MLLLAGYLLPIPAASTTINLAGQEVSTWFDQLSPLLVLLGIPVAVSMLGLIVWAIISGFDRLVDIFKSSEK